MRTALQPDETVMIGDGLSVDILAGKNAGTHTLLVLSGSSTREEAASSTVQPDHIFDDLAACHARNPVGVIMHLPQLSE